MARSKETSLSMKYNQVLPQNTDNKRVPSEGFINNLQNGEIVKENMHTFFDSRNKKKNQLENSENKIKQTTN